MFVGGNCRWVPHWVSLVRITPGGGGTPLQEVNRDVALDGVAF